MLKTVDFNRLLKIDVNRSINPDFLVQHPVPAKVQDFIRSYLPVLPVLNAVAGSRLGLSYIFLIPHSMHLLLECHELVSGQKEWGTFKSEMRKTVGVVCRLILSTRYPYLYLIGSETLTLITRLQQVKRTWEITKLSMLLRQFLYLFSLLGKSPSWQAMKPALLDAEKKGLGDKKLSVQKVWQGVGIVPIIFGAIENIIQRDFYNLIMLACRVFQVFQVSFEIDTIKDVNLKTLERSDILMCAGIALRCTATDCLKQVVALPEHCFNQAVALLKPRMWKILPTMWVLSKIPIVRDIHATLLEKIISIMSNTSNNTSNNYHIGVTGAPVQMDDVVGCEEAKQSIAQLIDQLLNPAPYRRLGPIKPIRGILFFGPPGTGKSMLAKAFATAVDNSIFLEQPGSSFTELYVGQGSQNIRKLFYQASRLAEANLQRLIVIFIDEINGIGARRHTSGRSSADMERANTTEAFLAAMDSTPSNVVVIGATNVHPQELDPAFVRSGRFDEHIEFKLPTEQERLKILAKLHAKYTLDPNIPARFWQHIAQESAGWCYADFTNLIQQVSTKAGRKRDDKITAEVYSEVFNKLKQQRSNYFSVRSA